MSKVEVYTFGGVRAKTSDGEPVWFRTRKTASLFAFLATQLGKEAPRDTITSIFWPLAETSFARNSLSVSLTSLRRQLEKGEVQANEVLFSDGRTVGLSSAHVWADIDEFHRYIKKSQLLESEAERQKALFEALDLYNGPFLSGDDESWAYYERLKLEQIFHQLLCRLLDSVHSEGDVHRALTQAGKALAWYPENKDLIKRVSALREKIGITDSPAYKISPVVVHDPEDLTYIRNLLERTGDELSSSVGEHLGGAVPLTSPYYLERDVDALFSESIEHKESILLIKGPRQIGKSSLLARGIDQARELGATVLLTDLQSMDSECLQSTKGLYLWLMSIFLDQLGLPDKAEAFWDDQLAPGINLERFMRDQILSFGKQVFWGLDEADRVFPCSFRSDFFGLLRSWHNRRALEPRAKWSNLTVVVTYATEAHFFIDDLNQSPFNVGVSFELADFEIKQLAEINQRYQNPLKNYADIQKLYGLVGGHPYLIRRALHELADSKVPLVTLDHKATTDGGPFADHLRGLSILVESSSELVPELRAVLSGQPPSNPSAFYRLRSAGIIKGQSPSASKIRCGLYQRFLEERLRVTPA